MKKRSVSPNRASRLLLSAVLIAAFALVVAPWAHAQTIAMTCTGPNLLPMHIVIDTSANTVAYKVMEEDDTTVWADKGVVPAKITANQIFWAADKAKDSPDSEYTLNRKTNQLTMTDLSNESGKRIVFSEFSCHVIE